MSKKSKEEERRILERMYGENDETGPDGSAESGENAGGENEQPVDERNTVPCPICGKRLTAGTKKCPKCGYSGYVPMTETQIAKVRLILFPIVLIIAVLLYLYFRGYFG